MMNVIVKIYPIIPLILLVVTILLTVSGIKKNNGYVKTTGTIVSFHEERSEAKISDDANRMISPVITYKANGNEYKFVGTYYTSSMKIGDNIEIMYDENNPSNAALKAGLFVVPIITGGLTLLFGLGYIILIVLKSKGII